MATATTHTVNLRPDLPVTLTEAGSGRPALVLHGGGGPFTVAGIADHLAETMRAITPTHPGWNGAARPDWLTGSATSRSPTWATSRTTTCATFSSSARLSVAGSPPRWPCRDDGERISGLVLLDAVGSSRSRAKRSAISSPSTPEASPSIPSTTPLASSSTRQRSRRSRLPGSAPTWRRCGRRRRSLHARPDAARSPSTDRDPRARHLGRQRQDRDPGLRRGLRRCVRAGAAPGREGCGHLPKNPTACGHLRAYRRLRARPAGRIRR